LRGKKKKERRKKVNPEFIVFLAVSLITLGSATLVVSSREIFHGAIYLAVMFLGIAGLFVMLNAEFLAAIQILVYAGAVTVLVLFAIMLTKREEKTEEKAGIPVLRGFASLLFLLVMMLYVVGVDWWNYSPKEEAVGSVTAIGLLLFTDYVLPFEVISLILLGAMIGAIALAKKDGAK
jgi:NADH-quinone oxidoreductase subunit J